MASALLTAMITVVTRRSASQLKTELRAIKKAGDKINKTPATARAFLRKNGFITRDNKVGKHYR